jgi:hypothetical protein
VSTPTFDVDEVQTRLQAITPEGWYVRPTVIERTFEPRPGYPAIRYEATAMTVRLAGKRGRYEVTRKIEVEIKAATVEALEEAVRRLPAVEPMLELPLDTEISISYWDD